MKNLSLFFVFFVPIFCFAQVNESFLDGNFINNPIWTGTTSNFNVNAAFQLQSKATATSTSFLFTPSEAIENASWECWVKVTYSTSSTNYAAIYLVSDKNDITSGCNGYYVQVGGTNDEVSLFVQEGIKKTKIIDGADKRTDGNPVELKIKVTRDANGNFALYSKLPTETNYVLEGTTQNNVVKTSNYFGLLFANTSTTGSCYYFDDIVVSGTKTLDKEAPVWNSFTLEQPNKLKLSFSEAMNFNSAAFSVNQEMGSPSSQVFSDDKTTLELTFPTDFEKGKLYTLQTTGLADLAGNVLAETSRTIGIVEQKAVGDLILNEVMFENPLNSLEYIEIYNKSDKLLDVSGLVLTTRKTDGTLNTGSKVPLKTLMLPHTYLALCANADSVRNYHHCLTEANILTATGSWYPLNNESSTLVLASVAKDTIFDELTYNVKWHNSWVTSPKGISLERTGSDSPTQSQFSWHSCVSSTTNHGTPGFRNSEYIDKEAPIWNSFTMEQPNKLQLVFSEAMDISQATFSVDNNLGNPAEKTISEDKTTLELTFPTNFERGKLYTLQTTGLADLAGNVLAETSRTIGIVEPKSVGDLILNEVMFENPLNSLEYIEIYNKSDKLLDVSGLVLTTRKTDGTLNTGSKVPLKTLILPHAYLALCANADSVRNYHHCLTEANILTAIGSWYPLNNESSTLVLASVAKDTIFDELTYNVKWHNSWVTSPKGISLERTASDLATQSQFSWHSSVSSTTNHGTPGFRNSEYIDKEAPVWVSFTMEQPNKLQLVFSEAMDISKATFSVDNNLGNPAEKTTSEDKTIIELTFASNFERGKLYTLQTSGLTDLAGNVLTETSRTIGMVEPKAVGDLVLNEVMFENPLNSLEYIEIYNKSDKLLDVSGLVLTTRKTDGLLNTGSKVPPKTLMLPHAYLALCANADSVRNYHRCPTEANILTTTGSWSSLNNESSTLVLASVGKDTIYDELTYNVKWHNLWVTTPKGISLEKTSPDLPTQSQFSWHSCVSLATNHGTPGFRNSEYIDKEAPTWNSFTLQQFNKLQLVFSEAMDISKATFSVDNNLGNPAEKTTSEDKTTIELTFASNFERGKLYKLQLSSLIDFAGNALIETSRTIGIVEPKAVGDLILNEVMFENPLSSLEYVEIYNKSDKLLDVSELVLTTRKTDGTLNTGSKVPLKTLMLPHAYLALCTNADSVRNYHHCPTEANILTTTGSWYPLNNESSTLVLAGVAKDTIYDELTYNVKWHNSWVTSPKGISLERIGFDLATQSQFSWHSCVSSTTNHGTPGFKNSEYIDKEVPTWNSFTLEQPNKLNLSFSEAMDFSSAAFSVNQEMGSPSSQVSSEDKTTLELTFPHNFERGKFYTLQTTGLADLDGNVLAETSRTIGIVEPKSVGDLILNEVMFENPLNSLEYIEIYNKSDKLLDVSGLVLTTRKTDGTLNTGSKVPLKTLMLPHTYLALCANADSVRNYHRCPTEANILTATGSWYSLNNESSTLVLASVAKDTIFDELTYNVKWHNSWVTNPKGISLERTGSDLPTQSQFSWHSCVSLATNHGTPGFKNSEYIDKEAPVWVSFTMEQPNKLQLVFSEAMDISHTVFELDNEIGNPNSTTISDDKITIELTFASNFERGKLYTLQTSGLADLAGNALTETSRTIGMVEPKAVGDLILNEVMFENPLNSLEYIEIYNKSDKLLDVSGLVFTTRKTDGTLNTGSQVPLKTLMLPHAYLALCANADSVRNYHHCPTEANILTATGSWSSLNNESSTLVLASVVKDTIYDDLTYNVKWHNSWVTSPKGISLEKTSPDLPTQTQFSWHSCVSSTTNHGTPGFRNSEYIDKEAPTWNSFTMEQPNKLKMVFSEAMDISKATFSVDNNLGNPDEKTISEDRKTIELTFASNFERGKIYTLQTTGLADLDGNVLAETSRTIGIVEPKAVGDLILNEVMFENPLSSLEYVEIYNKSDKLLDVSELVLTTRKTDGTLNTGSKVPLKTLMLPHAYLALCANADSVRNYHHCLTEANILTTIGSWYPLNNESSTLVLASVAKDTIYDELTYNEKWHNLWVTSPKGISLEKTSPDLPTQSQFSWHSCVSLTTNHGTPGFRNSEYIDKEAPIWNSFTLEQPNKLQLVFSEAMDISKATFNVDNNLGNPAQKTISEDKTTLELTFQTGFEKGKLYTLQTTGLADLAGNVLTETNRTIGIVEPKAVGDLILNEVMFENPLNSLEYIEIYNKSDKLLDVSGLVLTTRKSDGTLNIGSKVPAKTLMLPHAYLALCANADSVRNYHHCPTEANILTSTRSWSSLNNESSTLVLASVAKDTIYDELTYNVKWHNSWVTGPKGISLERTGSDLPTQSQFSWHSCVSLTTNHGTPGFKNSEYIDKEAPIWNSFTMEQSNKLKLVFSEAMDISHTVFELDNEIGNPNSTTISDDKTTIELTFASNFERGKPYTLQTTGLTDLAGNVLAETSRTIGIVEPKAVGDLILNEVMFENPMNSLEYIEIYNKSDKLLDVSGLALTTRKTDGTLNSGSKVPLKTLMLPHAYLALCANADSVRNFHNCPTESNIMSISGWSSLNNESSTLVLASVAKDTIYDELTYNVKWHNALVKNPKGVALERINPLLPTQNSTSWHSASSEVNYGTPGYKNSQYRDILSNDTSQKSAWTEPEAFSPDNDGVNDVCFIHYKTETSGYIANMLILNQVGVKVFHLGTNILLSSEGFLTWDGRTDKGKNVNIGIYVLYFEMFNPQTGIKKEIKLPIVVSSR